MKRDEDSSKTTTKKRPADVESGRYRLWEKLRRDRFNTSLEFLAELLPQREKGVAKWPKVEIVERASSYIKVLQAQRIPDDLQKRIRGLKRQNQKLREIIRNKWAHSMDYKEFSKLNLLEIQALIKKYEDLNRDKENVPNSSDQESPEKSGSSSGTLEEKEEGLSSKNSLVKEGERKVPKESSTDKAKSTSVILPTQTSTLRPITILSASVFGSAGWSFPAHRIVAINPNQLINSFPIIMRPLNKMPLPRLIKNSTRPSCNLFKNKKKTVLISKAADERVVLEETSSVSKKDKPKDDVVHDKVTDEDIVEKDDNSQKGADLSTSTINDYDIKASSTLPDAILASEDPLVQETENDVEERRELSFLKDKETSSKTAEPKKTSNQESSFSAEKTPPPPSLTPISIKKSKSSYSIAALCQISVNIGGDSLVPAETMVNSPGVVSLNSLGTASPSVTPAPPTPPAPTPPVEKKDSDKVIQELKPVPSSVLDQSKDHLPPPPPSKKTSAKSPLTSLKIDFKKCNEKVIEGGEMDPKKRPSSETKDITVFNFPDKKAECKAEQHKKSIASKGTTSIPKQWVCQQSLQQTSQYSNEPVASQPVKSVMQVKSSSKDIVPTQQTMQQPPKSVQYNKTSLTQQQLHMQQHQQLYHGYNQSNHQIHQQQQQNFHYGNNTNILNDFLGHPLQTASTSLCGSTSSQFHQGNQTGNQYNYSIPASGSLSSLTSNNYQHPHTSQSTTDYHQNTNQIHNHQARQQPAQQQTSELQELQGGQYFPYNRAYYSQQSYEIMSPIKQKQQQLTQQHIQQQASTQMNSMMQSPNTFSVNQLVNNSGSKTQRKGVKRLSSAATHCYDASSKKPNRSSNIVPEKDSRGKEDKKSSSRGNKPSQFKKGNYSAESLFADPQQVVQEANSMSYQHHYHLAQQQQQNQQHQNSKAKMDFTSNWTSSMMTSTAIDSTMTGSQFCSMSPSPFPQDLEFSALIPTNEPVSSSCYVAPSKVSVANFKTGGNKNSMTQNQNLIFDNNFFPLPTLTPPAIVEESSGFTNSSHVGYASQQKQNYNKHLSSGRFAEFSSLNHNNPVSNNQAVVASSSSLVNFNLSTIFPEINEKYGSVIPQTGGSSSVVSTTQTTSATSKVVTSIPSSADFRQISSSSEILPHSIAMLGQGTPTQNGLMTPSFPVNISSLNFQLTDQQ